jgi:hypothetical protein
MAFDAAGLGQIGVAVEKSVEEEGRESEEARKRESK